MASQVLHHLTEATTLKNAFGCRTNFANEVLNGQVDYLEGTKMLVYSAYEDKN